MKNKLLLNSSIIISVAYMGLFACNKKHAYPYEEIVLKNDTLEFVYLNDSSPMLECIYPYSHARITNLHPHFLNWNNDPDDTNRIKIIEVSDFLTFMKDSSLAYTGDLNTPLYEGYSCVPVLFIPPNSFSPNDDTQNDCWAPIGSYIDEIYYNISDENRLVLFEAHSLDTCWDGNYTNGNPAPQGLYYYYIRYSTPEVRNRVLKGELYLFR